MTPIPYNLMKHNVIMILLNPYGLESNHEDSVNMEVSA